MQRIDLHTKIVGVTFPNDDGTSRQRLIAKLKERIDGGGCGGLKLRREPDNPHDANAVAVLDVAGRQLGHLSRQVAEVVAPVMDGGARVSVSVSGVTGGGVNRYYGVNIRVREEPRSGVGRDEGRRGSVVGDRGIGGDRQGSGGGFLGFLEWVEGCLRKLASFDGAPEEGRRAEARTGKASGVQRSERREEEDCWEDEYVEEGLTPELMPFEDAEDDPEALEELAREERGECEEDEPWEHYCEDF